MEILKVKQHAGFIRLGLFNRQRTEDIKKENAKLQSNSEDSIGGLNKRGWSLLGAALYWAEGYKNFNQSRHAYPFTSFSNSDPSMAVFFINFLEKILDIPKEKIKLVVMTHPNIDSEAAVNYWMDITKYPRQSFKFYKSLSRGSNGKRPKNLLPYGTLQVRVNRRQDFFKIKGLISGIAKAKLI